jgi:uncharacterized membrane protein YoaK (UPF0700 family)
MPEPAPITRIVPALLSFTAGFVDACTFLALFGLFVAQVTGSFVVVGAEFVTHDEGVLIKVLAIPVFFGAGLATTIFAELLRRRGRRALAWTLAAECGLLAAFLLLGLFTPFRHEPNAPSTIAAALLGLSAMGVQSAAVRLLMPGVASTNVMTTNTTLFAIDAGELLLGWHGRRNSAEAAAQYAAARAAVRAGPDRDRFHRRIGRGRIRLCLVRPAVPDADPGDVDRVGRVGGAALTRPPQATRNFALLPLRRVKCWVAAARSPIRKARIP